MRQTFADFLIAETRRDGADRFDEDLPEGRQTSRLMVS
jgi:hypothetical protein